MPTTGGYITRANLPSGGLPNLDILVDPYWGLYGDDSQDAAMGTSNGIDPGQGSMKYIWADSPLVAGKQLVHFAPDNTTLVLKLLVNGTDQLDAQSKVAAIVQAVTQQFNYEVYVTLTDGGGTASYGWACYPAEYRMAFNMWTWQSKIPLYLAIPRDPIPLSGPV